MDIRRYRKAVAAVAMAIVELAALWQNAPMWVSVVVGLVGAWAVYRVPNAVATHTVE